MKKNKIIFLLSSLLLLGAGCGKKDEIIAKQQEQIDRLITALEEKTIAVSTSTNDKTSAQPQTIPSTKLQVQGQKSNNLETTQLQKTLYVPANQNNEPLALSGVQAIPTVDGVTFTWTTNIPSTGYVTIWPVSTVTGNTQVQSNNPSLTHSVNSNYYLVSNKKYSYTITAKDAKGNIAVSDEKSFTTPLDNLAPVIKISPISISGSGILFSLSASERSFVKITWGITKNQSAYWTLDANKPTTITLLLESGGYSPGTSLNFSLVGSDDAGNITTFNKIYTVGNDLPMGQ